jgi:molybdopterin-guanine dinucleotide biosynthesis protein A
VADTRPGLGSLGGIYTAVVEAPAPVVCVAWDMPFVTGELLCELRRRGEAGARAVVPVHGAEGWAEPLCAWYSPGVLSTCRALLEAGARRAGALLDAMLPDAETVGDEVLTRFGDPGRLFTSVDTPDALAALGGTLGSRG